MFLKKYLLFLLVLVCVFFPFVVGSEGGDDVEDDPTWGNIEFPPEAVLSSLKCCYVFFEADENDGEGAFVYKGPYTLNPQTDKDAQGCESENNLKNHLNDGWTLVSLDSGYETEGNKCNLPTSITGWKDFDHATVPNKDALECCEVSFMAGAISVEGIYVVGPPKDSNVSCGSLSNLKNHYPTATQLIAGKKIDRSLCTLPPMGYNPNPPDDEIPGTYTLDVCSVQKGGVKMLLPSVIKTEAGEYKSNSETYWKSIYGDSVKCVKNQAFSDVKPCNNTSDCPIGGYCKTTEAVGRFCEFYSKCSSDADCKPSAIEKEVGDSRQMKCETEKQVCVLEESGECGCPFGMSESINGCSSPLCISLKNTTGLCSAFGAKNEGGKWTGGTYQCTEVSTSLKKEYCGESKNCWQGKRQVPDPKTASGFKWYPLMEGPSDTCCVNNECGGDISLCLEEYLGQGLCPPSYKFQEAITDYKGGVIKPASCDVSCPIDSSFACKKDEDCDKKKALLKEGETYKCVNVEDYESDTMAKLTEEQIKACNRSDMGRVCKKEGGATTTESVGEEYEGIPWSIPDTSGLNQLNTKSVPVLIGNLIKTATGLMGSVGLAMFVYGGLLWMTAAGNSERQKKAMNILLWSSMGIIVILASYTVVSFVFKAFGIEV